MRRSLIIDTHGSSCYFRTSVEGDGRKALIQITERCNLHCAHCFVSSGDWGEHMSRKDIVDKVLPRLSTPNMLTEPGEFAALCEFAVEVGARYVLMNPLSAFGRGVKSQGKLAAGTARMRAIREVTEGFRSRGIDVVHIRFPNDDKPLAGCDAGKLIYVFADGLTAVCPYLVFAARTPRSPYPDSDFLVGNILDGEIAEALDGYDLAGRLAMGGNDTCRACAMARSCGKGCPAAVISRGQPIGEVDSEQCPVVASPLLQIEPRPR
jgi:radical SAM protein with 4Fe4S-binding SPASM domain